MTIDLQTQDTPVIAKTKELCETILQQSKFQSLQQNVDTFLADNEARRVYESLIEKQEFLVNKQQSGHTLTEDEIEDFEKDREALLANAVAGAYINAQEQIQQLQSSIVSYVSKTIELGRVPTEADLSTGCCGGGGGGGCGCSG